MSGIHMSLTCQWPTTVQQALMERWSWAAEKRVMNKNSATGLRAACVQVLGVLDDPDQADVARMDIEDLLTRFRNPRKQRPKPQILEIYQRRFRSAVKVLQRLLGKSGRM